MKKPISIFTMVCTILILPGFRPTLSECRADSTLHVLEYPPGYGCHCCPNVQEFGYYRTTWRMWPCEARPDIYFPRSIGMEVLPAPQGEKEVPLPKAPVAPPGETHPGQPPSGETYPGQPPSGLTYPGQPPPGLTYPGQPPSVPEGGLQPPGGSPPAGLPQEPKLPEETKQPSAKTPAEESLPKTPSGTLEKGFNPTPGLPTETPPPMEPAIPELPGEPPNHPKSTDNKSTGRTRNAYGTANTFRRNASVELRLVEKSPRGAPPLQSVGRERSAERPETFPQRGAPSLQRLPHVPPPAALQKSQPSAGPRADWNASLQPGAYGERARPSWYSSSDDLAQAARYDEPADVSAQERRGSRIVPQTYQEWADAGRAPPAAPRRTHLAIEGYCPVELARSGRWVEGDPHSSAVYRGQVYRFSSVKQRQQFLAAPEKYAPAFEGRDPVVLAREKRSRSGRVDYCAMYHGRIYLFTNAATRMEFQRHPQRYGVSED